MLVYNILIGMAAMIIGALICFFIFRLHSKGILRKAEEEAEVIKKNKII